MKKILLIFLIISSFLIACNSNSSTTKNLDKDEKIETLTTHGNFIEYHDEEDLFDAAELVIIAKANENFFEREHIVKYARSFDPINDLNLPPAIEDFYTRTTVEVIDVLKKPEDFLIEKNRELTIIEPITLMNEEIDY